MKTLSVVIPSYNSEKTIEASIQSVVKECDSCGISYEIIVVDDGSSDSSPNIIQNLATKNKNIIYIKQENTGPSAARNNGLSVASGNFIALNDSDDIWLDGKLKCQFEYFNSHNDIDLVACQYKKSSIYNKEKIVSFKNVAFHNYFSTPTVVFRNKIKNVKFPENLKYSEDMRFFLTVMLDYKCVYLPKLAAKNYFNKFSFGDSGLSSKLLKMEKGELSNIRFIFANKKISLTTFIAAYLYSLAKFIRRCIITTIRKLIHK